MIVAPFGARSRSQCPPVDSPEAQRPPARSRLLAYGVALTSQVQSSCHTGRQWPLNRHGDNDDHEAGGPEPRSIRSRPRCWFQPSSQRVESPQAVSSWIQSSTSFFGFPSAENETLSNFRNPWTGTILSVGETSRIIDRDHQPLGMQAHGWDTTRSSDSPASTPGESER